MGVIKKGTGHITEAANPPDLDVACNLIDKMILRQLHLMEDKMNCELHIENSIKNGSLQLAKSRYIMGHSSISATKLPIENSPEFSASTVCKRVEEHGIVQLKAVASETDNKINPIRWFGVLVPKNLHAAQEIFQNALDYVVECSNIQLKIKDNMGTIEALKEYKNKLQSPGSSSSEE